MQGESGSAREDALPGNEPDQLDYEALGFKAGLEIHQQLDTRTKLFCRCPAELRDGPHDAEIVRHMRPTLSELGEYDGTALMEFKTRKTVTYQLFRDAICTYEMDDTPPFALNQQALEIALEIGLLLGCSIVDELHISRKQYLDGSIPAGFQRTGIIGISGRIPLGERTIGITQLGLEEDACREVEDRGHNIVFRTDRLSIPLVEVVTDPDLKSPDEVARAAWQIGRLLRVTRKVKRGIGSVRQDVNVSIAGGTRVEIKGVSRIGYIPALVENEVRRQRALLEIREILRDRGVTEQSMTWDKADVTELLGETASPLVRKALDEGAVVRGIMLRGFAGMLDRETQSGVPFAHDFAGRVRVIACLDGRPNMLRTSQFDSYELGADEVKAVRAKLGAKITDETVLVWGDEQDVETALEEIRIRATEATQGVPNETRQPLGRTGITDFERILPGADRMYPDTDSPPQPISRSRIENVASRLPELPWDREARYSSMGLSAEIAVPMSVSPRAELFDRIVERTDVRPAIVAVALDQTTKALRRDGVNVEQLDDDGLMSMFAAMHDGRFEREAIPAVLREIAATEERDVDAALRTLELEPVDEAEAVCAVTKAVAENGPSLDRLALSDPTGEKCVRLVMGEVMSRLRGRFSGERLRELAAEALSGTAGLRSPGNCESQVGAPDVDGEHGEPRK